MQWCKACSSSDPTTDTVRVSFPSTVSQEQAQEQEKQEPEVAGKTAEAEESARQVAEAAAAEAAARRAEEERRLAAEAAERRRIEDEERCRVEAEERRRQEEAAARLEQERLERQRQEAAAEEARRAKEAEDLKKLGEFLKQKGYKDVNAKKKSLFSHSFPLHAAVKANDVELVRIMLAQGADPSATNSAGQTARQMAETANKRGSHSALLKAMAGARTSVGGA